MAPRGLPPPTAWANSDGADDLAAKAEFYEEELARIIKRTPFGYTAEVGLQRAGDRSSARYNSDSDNDWVWTAMYGAVECLVARRDRR
jgi:hypothetical protein